VDRLAALSDGVFAVAMTLMVLDLIQLNYAVAPRFRRKPQPAGFGNGTQWH
jgi:hypothetical protein